MGHRVIRGALIPSSYIIGSMKKYVTESIAPQNLTDRAMFGLSTRVVDGDLQNNLTDSVVITNT